MAEVESRGGGASGARDSMPSTFAPSASSPRPIATNRAVRPASEPSASRIRKQLTTEGDGQPLRTAVAPRLVVRARHEGATVPVVLDELPEVPSSPFVLAKERARAVVSIDALAGWNWLSILRRSRSRPSRSPKLMEACAAPTSISGSVRDHFRLASGSLLVRQLVGRCSLLSQFGSRRASRRRKGDEYRIVRRPRSVVSARQADTVDD